jgi:hypothetical protein
MGANLYYPCSARIDRSLLSHVKILLNFRNFFAIRLEYNKRMRLIIIYQLGLKGK